MKTGEEKYNEILEQMEIVKINGSDYYEQDNKAAGLRLRKALMNISKLNKVWRKEVIAKKSMGD